MRVLHLAAGNLFGGIETYLLTLARMRHLCPEMEPHFGVCFPGRLRDELIEAASPVHDLGPVRMSRPWTVLRARRRMVRAIRDCRIEAVITHGTWTHAVFAPAARRAGTRLVNLVHDELAGRHWIDRWAARTNPDLVIANSRFTAEAAKCVFTSTPVEVVYHPVSVSPSGSEKRDSLRASLLVPDGATVILQASRLEAWKGHAVHVAALARLNRVPGWVAWIAGGPQKAGEGELLAELKATAVAAGISDRVRFLGQRSDVADLMTAADVYCQPNSGPEPFGIAFVEALSAGLPVVTSDFGGAVEIVTGACGVVCPPGDVDAVAAALSGLIADPDRRRRLGAAGPGWVAELCDPSRQLAALTAAITKGTRPCSAD